MDQTEEPTGQMPEPMELMPEPMELMLEPMEQTEDPMEQMAERTDQTAELALLSDYITRCINRQRTAYNQVNRDVVFGPENGLPKPLLRRGQINRIVIFQESFNPPHLGHYRLLKKAVRYSQDMNVVAAIVVPQDDHTLHLQSSRTGETLHITQRLRVQLWRGPNQSNWFYVFDGNEIQWQIFKEELTRFVKDDGFDLEFVPLLGAESLKKGETPPWNELDANCVIYGDISRPARTWMTQTTLGGYGPWRRLEWDNDTLQKYAEAHIRSFSTLTHILDVTMQSLGEPATQDLVETLAKREKARILRRLKNVMVCDCESLPGKSVRFIKPEEPIRDVGSAHMRSIILRCPTEIIGVLLSTKALNHALLTQEACAFRARLATLETAWRSYHSTVGMIYLMTPPSFAPSAPAPGNLKP